MMDEIAGAREGSDRFPRMHRLVISLLGSIGLGAGAASGSTEHPNILFFGNSFTQSYSPKDVPTLLRDIHLAADQPTGIFFRRTNGGFSLQAHLQNTGENSVEYLAAQTLPEGESWDYVVLQGNSTESTTTAGNPANFVASGLAIFDIIRQSNPDTKAVLFQTWARNENVTGFYPTPFENPAAMQAEIRTSYRQLYTSLLDTYGAESARYAGAGDAFGELGWSTSLYNGDYYHANNRGELLVALTLYGALHGPVATPLASRGVLDGVAASIGLSSADLMSMAIAADAVGVERGDTDLDWDVDFDDLLRLAQNYGRLTTTESPTDWFTGDFDLSGAVDFDDLLGLAQHYGAPSPGQIGSGTVAADWALALSLVPEPVSTMSVAGIGVLCLLRRR